MLRKLLITGIALSLFSIGAVPAIAQREAKNFTAHLTGADEVPPVTTDATGQAVFNLVSPTSMRFRLTVDDIENVVAAHIHCGASGSNGPVVQFLFGNAPAGGGPFEGVLGAGTFDPSTKTCTFGPNTISLVEAMRAGLTYTNVHTNDGVDPQNTGAGDMATGEIRGQNEPRG